MNYFGFTNKNNLNHSSSSTAGISMSEYTFKLLSEIRNAKFIITTDKNIDKLQSSEKKFYLRNSKYFSIKQFKFQNSFWTAKKRKWSSCFPIFK